MKDYALLDVVVGFTVKIPIAFGSPHVDSSGTFEGSKESIAYAGTLTNSVYK